MSTPEPASVAVVVLARVRQPEPPPVANTRKSVTRAGCCVRTEAVPELDDMQTPIANAHTPAAATASVSSSDQEVPEVVLPSSPSKRRRLVYDHAPEHLNPTPSELALGPEGCEDSGLTAERHMADLDRTSKSSTPEDIDSATAAAEAAAAPVATSQLAALAVQPQCSTSPTEQVVEQEQVVVQVPMPREPLQILEHLHFSSSPQPNVVVVEAPDRTSPGDDDISQYSTSRLLPPTGHIRVPDSRISTHSTKTMATGGGDNWLQLSLGSHGPSDEAEPPATVPLDSYQQQQQAQSPTTQNPLGMSITPDPPGIRDFFKSQEVASSSHRFTPASPYRPTTGESSRQQHYFSSEPGSHHPRAGSSPSLSRPLFLEPQQPRASRDSGWLDPNVHTPRVPPGDHYTLPVSQRGSFTPQQFSNVPALPYHPARILQPVRSEPTDTTAVHARRSSHEAGPSSGPQYPSAAPWMQQHTLQPNPAEPFLSMGATPGPSLRDWRSGPSSSPFLNVQLPVAQGVDAEQAWRNLLQRVGNNMAVAGASTSSSGGARPPEPMMMPPGEREEYLDALKRAVERFQGADQVLKFSFSFLRCQC